MNYIKSYLRYEIFFMYFLHLLRFLFDLIQKTSEFVLIGFLLSPKSETGQEFLDHGSMAALVIIAFTLNQLIKYMRHNDRVYQIQNKRFETVVISFFCILLFSAAYSSGIENAKDLLSFSNTQFIQLLIILLSIRFTSTKIIPKIQLSIATKHLIDDHPFTLAADRTDTNRLYKIADEFADRLAVERVIRTVSNYRDSEELEGITDEIVIRLKLSKEGYVTVPFFTYLNYSNRLETVTYDRAESETLIGLETSN